MKLTFVSQLPSLGKSYIGLGTVTKKLESKAFVVPGFSIFRI
jgi:hypothetical protein